jgi:uncharacterized membrane protein
MCIDLLEGVLAPQEVTMFGFAIAAVSLFVFVKVLRGVGYLGRFGHGAYAGYGCPGGSRRFGRPPSLRSALERLGTTPGQEKVVLRALDELRSNRSALVEEAKATRAELGSAIESGTVDDTTLDEMFARHDRLLARLRVSFVEALKQVSEALDERQRKELASLLQSQRPGPFGWSRPRSEGHIWA